MVVFFIEIGVFLLRKFAKISAIVEETYCHRFFPGPGL